MTTKADRLERVIQAIQKHRYPLNINPVLTSLSGEYDGDRHSDPDLSLDDRIELLLSLTTAKDQHTLFHIACRRGHLDVLKYAYKLVRTTKYINKCDCRGNTALHFAAAFPNSEKAVQMIDLLCTLGADYNSINNYAQTPLATHLMTMREDVTDVLCAIIAKFDASEDTIAVLNRFVSNPGTSYLHIALERNLTNVACVLVANGVNTNVPDVSMTAVSDITPKKTLVKLISCMVPGQQQTPSHVPRIMCKVCKGNNTSELVDCDLCGRIVCLNCSYQIGKLKYGLELYRTQSKNEHQLCVVCITVLLLKEKHILERKHFLEKLHGCSSY